MRSISHCVCGQGGTKSYAQNPVKFIDALALSHTVQQVTLYQSNLHSSCVVKPCTSWVPGPLQQAHVVERGSGYFYLAIVSSSVQSRWLPWLHLCNWHDLCSSTACELVGHVNKPFYRLNILRCAVCASDEGRVFAPLDALDLPIWDCLRIYRSSTIMLTLATLEFETLESQNIIWQETRLLYWEFYQCSMRDSGCSKDRCAVDFDCKKILWAKPLTHSIYVTAGQDGQEFARLFMNILEQELPVPRGTGSIVGSEYGGVQQWCLDFCC